MTMKFKAETRCGGEYRMYATDAGGEWSNHGAVLKDGVWLIRTWNDLGRIDEEYIDDDDLLPLREPSEAAVEAAMAAWVASPKHLGSALPDILRAAYEVDFPEGGK